MEKTSRIKIAIMMAPENCVFSKAIAIISVNVKRCF
jgi:hypothetical protein